MKTKSILVYCGLHRGNGLAKRCRNYDMCYGFEANPELYACCKQRFSEHNNVHIVHAALTTFNGSVSFNISSNDGLSSSLGDLRSDWPGQFQMPRTVDVPALNLLDFCRQQAISHITDYVSDLQGMDLTILKTLAPMIEEKRIETIQCEVAKDSRQNIYDGLGSNGQADFEALLSPHYIQVAEGWGSLYDGVFASVPDSWWEMDCKWAVDSARARRRLALRRRTGFSSILGWLRSRGAA